MKEKNIEHSRTWRLMLVLTLSLTAILTAKAQSVQEGVVMEYRGKTAKTPLANVAVSATNAGAAMSDAKGAFTLQFRTLKAGEGIQFRRIERSGYEVMNKEAVEVMRVARANGEGESNRLQIVMISTKMLSELRDGYRSVASQRYEKQLKAAQAEVEKLKKEGKMQEDEYNEKLDALEEEYEDKLSKLENYIDKFARIDLTTLDSDEQKVIDLVKEGKFDEALDYYEKQNLAAKLTQSREDHRKLVEAKQQIASAIDTKQAESEYLRQAIDRQITLLRMAGGEENMRKVHELLKQTFLADTTHVESRRYYARSLFDLDQRAEANALLESALVNVPDPSEKDAFFEHIMIYSELVANYWASVSYDKAMHYALKADSLYTPHLTEIPQLSTRALPAISQTIIKYHNMNGEFDEVTQLENKLLQYWNLDSLFDGSLAAYARLCSCLNEYYSYTGNHEKTLWATNTGLEIGELLYKQFPWASNLDTNYASACSTYALEGQRDKAQNAALRTIELCEETLNKSPTVNTLVNLSTSFYTILDALVCIDEIELADEIIQKEKTLGIFEKTLRRCPNVMDYVFALYRMNEVQVMLSKCKSSDAETVEKASMMAEEAIRNLSLWEEYESALTHYAPALRCKINIAKGNLKEAKTQCQEAINAQKAIYDESEGDAWEADSMCRYYLLMAEVAALQKDKKTFKRMMKLAKEVAAFEGNRQSIERIENKYK